MSSQPTDYPYAYADKNAPLIPDVPDKPIRDKQARQLLELLLADELDEYGDNSVATARWLVGKLAERKRPVKVRQRYHVDQQCDVLTEGWVISRLYIGRRLVAAWRHAFCVESGYGQGHAWTETDPVGTNAIEPGRLSRAGIEVGVVGYPAGV